MNAPLMTGPSRDDVHLVASDLDGTLFDSSRQVSGRTIEALQAAAAAGLTVIAATGRSHWTAVPRLRPVGVIRWAVCSNGSSVHDLETDTLVERSVLSVEACDAIMALPSLLPGVGLAWELVDGVRHDEAFVQIRRGQGLTLNAEEPTDSLRSPHEMNNPEINKVMVGHAELDHDELLAVVRPLLPDDLEISSAGLTFIEITAPGVEKGATLDRLTDRLGISPDRSMAFGDQQNDLGMLAWSGYGYAMANAHPTVLAATTLRAPHHDDHGVAQVIESLLG